MEKDPMIEILDESRKRFKERMEYYDADFKCFRRQTNAKFDYMVFLFRRIEKGWIINRKRIKRVEADVIKIKKVLNIV